MSLRMDRDGQGYCIALPHGMLMFPLGSGHLQQSEGGGSRSRSSVSHRSRFWSSTVGEGHSAMSMAGSSSS